MKWISLAFLTIVSCAAPHPAEEQARQFIQAYYVAADLQEATRLTEGLARDKIDASAALTQGITKEPGEQPSVSFVKLDGRADPDEAEYLFKVTIRPNRFPEIEKTSRLKLRRRSDGWRVTQFSE